MNKNYRFIVTGRVQGVYYRKNIQENSSKKGFNGCVKNLIDGSVEACVTCEEKEVENFIEILKKGSPNSIVDSIEQFEVEEIFTNGFEIRY